MKSQEMITRAVSLHQAGCLKEASEIYLHHLAKNPEDSQVRHLYGMALYRSGMVAEADVFLRQSIVLDPCSVIFKYNYANYIHDIENNNNNEIDSENEKVFRILHELYIIDKCFFHGVLSYAVSLNKHGDVDKAKNVIRVAICAEPGNRLAYRSYASILFEVRDHVTLQRIAARALTLDPDDGAVIAFTGSIALEQGDFGLALSRLNRAVEILPDVVNVHEVLTRIESLAGLKEKALRRQWRIYNNYFNNGNNYPVDEESSDAILDRIDRYVPDDGEVMIYPFNRSPLVGHVCYEPACLRNIFSEKYKNIVFLGTKIPPENRVNRDLFDAMMFDFRYIECDDLQVTSLSFGNIGVFARGNRTYCIQNSRFLDREYAFHFNRTRKYKKVNLPSALIDRGDEAAKKLGVSPDAPVVVIHMRESGYHQGCETTFSLRDVTVSNYIPAIRYLLRQGYTVVRIGDSSMTPLPDMGPGLIDAPRNGDYAKFLDMYFLSRCAFMIASISGPVELARALGCSVLSVNGVMIHNQVSAGPCDLYAFKRILDPGRRGRQALSFEEMIRHRIPEVDTDRKLRNSGFVSEELSANEILAITREMINLITSGKNMNDSTPEFRKKAAEFDSVIREDKTLLHSYVNFFAHGLSNPVLSDEYCFYNDGFL